MSPRSELATDRPHPKPGIPVTPYRAKREHTDLHAHDDEALARKLLLGAATPASAKADVASLHALIEQAFAHREFVPYREVWGYVRGIEDAIDVLEAQLEQGDGGDVVDLAEHALKLAEGALDHSASS